MMATGFEISGEGRNRTGDTTVFSRVLYQLSYLAGQRGERRVAETVAVGGSEKNEP